MAKRRIYDITNVLEGIGLIEKKSKNNVRWRYAPPRPRACTAARTHVLRCSGELDGSEEEPPDKVRVRVPVRVRDAHAAGRTNTQSGSERSWSGSVMKKRG